MKRNITRHRPIKILTESINYKNVLLLRKFINPEGKILPKRLTKVSTKQQRRITRAIKNARISGLLPFVRITFY